MIVLFLAFLSAVISGAFFLFGEVPTFMRWVSLVLGCFIVLSRVLAWQSGAAQGARNYLESIAEDDKSAANMLFSNTIMEFIFWGLALVNIFFFL